GGAGAGVVVVVVVGVVSGPSWAMVIVTVEPLEALLPGPGFWLSTLPDCEASLVWPETTLALKPACSRGVVASVWLSPTTFGTGPSFGACATTRSTSLCALTELPLAGDCESTVSGDCVELAFFVTVPTDSPALASVASAAERDSPVTSGTL